MRTAQRGVGVSGIFKSGEDAEEFLRWLMDPNVPGGTSFKAFQPHTMQVSQYDKRTGVPLSEDELLINKAADMTHPSCEACGGNGTILAYGKGGGIVEQRCEACHGKRRKTK